MSSEVKQAMALRYKQHVLGWAYIPIQDLPMYERAYKEVYGVNSSQPKGRRLLALNVK